MTLTTNDAVSLGGSSSRENCSGKKDSESVGRDLSLCCLNTNSQRDFVLVLDQQNAKLRLALELVSIS